MKQLTSWSLTRMPPSCSERSNAYKSRWGCELRTLQESRTSSDHRLDWWPPLSQKTPMAKHTLPYLVTLKILKRRTHRNTEIPRGDMISSSTKMVSVIPPHTTKQSNRLKRETKYAWRPKLYIFTSISQVKRAKRTLLAISGKTEGTHPQDLIQDMLQLLSSPGTSFPLLPTGNTPMFCLFYYIHNKNMALMIVCFSAGFWYYLDVQIWNGYLNSLGLGFTDH